MSWFTRMTGVDKVVEQKINDKINGLKLPLVNNSKKAEYRMKENQMWASSDADNLLTFYKTHTQTGNYLLHNRLRFWQWVGGVDVPKLHYPAPEALMNHLKSILFSGDVSIYIDEEDEAKSLEINERVAELLKDVEWESLIQQASIYESYSGSVAFKFIIDAEVHDRPIIEAYPRERFDLITKWGKVQAIVFKDDYTEDKRDYQLHSIYGKGTINYKLYDDKGKEVPLSKVPDLADLQDQDFGVPILMAAWKKNKAVSNEFPDLPYGGSDFEGVIDLFHQIDEIYSTMALYIRRSRPILMVDESILPTTIDGKTSMTPKEYYYDLVKMKPKEENKDKIFRNTPEIKVEQYTDAINGLNKAVYQTVGMSYTSVGLEGVGANVSGASLVQQEKATVIIRDAKIKLWVEFIPRVIKLLLIYDDILNKKLFNLEYLDLVVQVEFPEYNGQTYLEKITEMATAKQSGLIDTETAVERIYQHDYTQEQRNVITRNIKIERGESFVSPKQAVNDEGLIE